MASGGLAAGKWFGASTNGTASVCRVRTSNGKSKPNIWTPIRPVALLLTEQNTCNRKINTILEQMDVWQTKELAFPTIKVQLCAPELSLLRRDMRNNSLKTSGTRLKREELCRDRSLSLSSAHRSMSRKKWWRLSTATQCHN